MYGLLINDIWCCKDFKNQFSELEKCKNCEVNLERYQKDSLNNRICDFHTKEGFKIFIDILEMDYKNINTWKKKWPEIMIKYIRQCDENNALPKHTDQCANSRLNYLNNIMKSINISD